VVSGTSSESDRKLSERGDVTRPNNKNMTDRPRWPLDDRALRAIT